MNYRINDVFDQMSYCELSDYLDQINCNNIHLIKTSIPRLLRNRRWIIKTDVLDIIGECKLTEYKNEVLNVLNTEKNHRVLCYALYALYDLEGSRCVPVLEKFVKHKAVSVRIVATTYLYMEKESNEYISFLSNILLRKNCNHYHQSNFLSIVKRHAKLQRLPRIIILLNRIVTNINPNKGVYKDINTFLDYLMRN